MFKPICFLAVLFACSPSLALDQASSRLTLSRYLDFERVSDPRLSPDGSRIIYTRQWIDKINDKRESSLWIMLADGTRNRHLVDGFSARWSPSGDRIAYIARGEPKGSQIFVRWMDAEGAITQITHVDQTPSNLAWSPAGTQIAFTMQVVDSAAWPVKLPAAPAGAKWTDNPKIIQRLKYRQDRIGYTDTGRQHIFVAPAEGGTPRQITSGEYDLDPLRFLPADGPTVLEWTPNGKTIVFSGLRIVDTEYQFRESEIYAAAVTGGSVRQLTKRKGPDANPKVSPDGKLVAYTGYDRTNDRWIDSKIYVMEIDGSNPRLASGDWDRSPREMFWASDGSGVYFTAQSEGQQNFYFLPLTGSRAHKVVPVTHGEHILSVSRIGRKGKAVGVRSSVHAPADIVSFDLRRPSEVEQLTFVNEDILAGVQFGKVEEIWITAPDGVESQGWYITPPDFDSSKKYPLQLHIHGGPHAMYGVGFNFAFQEHAAKGYVILYTNPRGSTGYGSKFGNMVDNAYPGPDYLDLMAGVDALLAKGFVDPESMFVLGCSGGGILTAWIVTRTDRFAAASSNCTIVDWISLAGTTDVEWVYYRFPKPFWEDPGPWIEHSSIFHVGKVKTPTMLMTGERDLNTPISQAEQFYHALKFRGVPTALVRFKNEWHGTGSTPSNFLRTQLYLRYWFEKFQRSASGRSTVQ